MAGKQPSKLSENGTDSQMQRGRSTESLSDKTKSGGEKVGTCAGMTADSGGKKGMNTDLLRPTFQQKRVEIH